MRQFLLVLAVFVLGLGASQLSFLVKREFWPKRVTKPVITKEATSTPPLKILTNPSNQETATVKRVIDGDTVELADGRRLRYIGIDTPELYHPQKPVECFGQEAKEANRTLVEGKTVRLEKDIFEVDKYGRLLRYIYIEDTLVNDYLVRQGFARASTYPPDIAFSDEFRLAEEEARENNRGLWAGCPLNPTNTTNPTNVMTSPSAQTGCVIKGNISASGEKIYHLPGCGSYGKTVIDENAGERWFCTEDEAVAAGWHRAKNCWKPFFI